MGYLEFIVAIILHYQLTSFISSQLLQSCSRFVPSKYLLFLAPIPKKIHVYSN